MNTGLIWDNLVIYSVQIGLLVGLAGFVPSLLRLRWPGAKLIYWQVLLTACLLLPLVRPWRHEAIAAVGVSVSNTVAMAVPAGPATQTTIPRGEMALLLLTAGALVRLGWLGVGFWRLRRYRLNARPLERSTNRAANCPALLSYEIGSPVTFGWRRPVVLLPARFPEMDSRVQEAILCHELLHVERRDWLFTVAEEVVRALFWFHPAIWWVLGEIQLAREQAVDFHTIERTAARDEYVDALLAVAGVKAHMDLSVAPLFLRKRHLKRRVISIFKESPMSKTRWISRLAVGLATLAAACWLVTGTLRLAAAPQVVNDAAGVTVDTGSAALLHRAPVSYPESARHKGVQGTVTLEARIDGSGNVTDAHVLSGPDELRRPALESVLQWHFQGTGSSAAQTVSIAFRIPEANRQAVPQTKEAQQVQLRVAPQDLQRVNTEAPGKLKSIVIVGLSDAMRDELLARLPAHEGDTLAADSITKIAAAVRAFDEHLTYRASRIPGEVTLTITAPGYSPEAPLAVNASAAKLIRQPRPVYPPEAKAAGISGVVKLSAIIAADGTVANLQVISGHPLLVPAALEAVKQWVYQPTLLNGSPVEVKTEISVNFTLSE